MYLTEVKKRYDCNEDCECKKCEMRSANDDKDIRVSVSPRRFELPTGTEKRAKMKIKNKNPYPIYFKASTSNMGVFRPQPINGLIPPNKKVSVDVKFYDSAMPLRCHEEIIVLTSVKPIEQLALYKERSCSYCMESFDFSKRHRHSHADGYSTDPDHQSYNKNGKQSKYVAKEDEEDGASHYEDFEIKYKVPKQKMKTERDEKFREKKKRNKLQDEDEEKIPKQYRDYAQTYPKMSHLDEKVYKNRDYLKSKHTICNHELQELCIHALVHKPSASGCECRNCVELWTGQEERRKLESYLRSEKENYARGWKIEEDDAEDRLYRTEKGTYALRQAKDGKDERKGKGREAHILARILRAERGKASLSDTDLSELISRGTLTKITKIISEEDYKKKKDKLKNKLLKPNAEESESTTTEDTKNQKEGSEEETDMMKRKSTLKALDEKCNTLINLSWANLFFMLLLMVTVVGSFTFCCRPGLTDRKYLHCLYDILENFG